MPKILIVDDEASIRSSLGRFFERVGYDVLHAPTGAEGIRLIEDEHPSVVLLDLQLPDMSGFEVIEQTRALRPVVIMITGNGDIPAAVRAMENGAEGFLTKPVELSHLGAVVGRALEKAELRELRRGADMRNARLATNMLLGSSPPMRELAEQIELLARSERTAALLVGETGVGKARAARAIHELSARASRPLHEVMCGLRPERALETELFGCELPGEAPIAGLFEAADGGTLFLDEIADLPAMLQPTLLRVLESRRVRRCGGSRDVAVDVRIIAATVKDLATEVTEQRFREDLYYYLGVMPLYLPPLRARSQDDLRETVFALMAELARGLPDVPLEVTEQALGALVRYPWPGNIREMRNVLERGLLQARGEPALELTHLTAEVRGLDGDLAGHKPWSLAEVEQMHIERTLRVHGANRTRAARDLGISRATLIKKIREYRLASRDSGSSPAGDSA